jgi:hypothetical protein
MALASAAAIMIVLLAAAAAIAANLGMLRVVTDTGSAGGLNATDLAPAVTSQQPAGDGETARTEDDTSSVEDRQPGADRSGGVEPGEDHRPDDTRQGDERYEGRDDDD